MQDHWSKVHQDMRAIYEEISSSKKDEKSVATSSGTEEQSKVRVREAIYKIRSQAKQQGKPLSRAYQEYIANSSLSPAEKAKVKARVMGTSEEYVYHMESLQFDEQTGQYKVRVTESNSGKIFVRTISLQKVHELRSMPDSYNFATEAKKLDPVGQEDGDIDNDGDEDENDKYLKKRRKAIGKAIENQKEDLEVHEDLMKETLDRMKENENKRTLGSRFKNDAERQEYIKKIRQRSKEKYQNRLRATYEEVELDEAMRPGERQRKMAAKRHDPYATSRDRGTAHNVAVRGDVKPGDPSIKSRGGGGVKKDKGMGYGDRGAGNKARRRLGQEPLRGTTRREEVEAVDEANMTPEQLKKINDRIAKQGIQYPTGKLKKTSVALRKEKEAMKKEGVEVTEKKKDDTYLETDMKKRQANNEKARKELAKGPQMKNPHFEDYDPMDDPDFDHDEAERNRGVSGKNNPKGGKALAKKKTRKEEIELPFGDMKALIKRAVKRVDADVDGDVDAKDKKSSGEMGEFVPTPDGKKKTTRVKEGYSWRNDLIEVMGDKLDDDSKKKIDVMKGKNKVNINPKEEVDLSDSLEIVVEGEGSEKKYCRLCKKKETKSQCGFGPKMWEKYSVDDASEKEVENAADESGISDGGVSEQMSPQEQQIQKKQIILNRMKLVAQQKAIQQNKKPEVSVATEEAEKDSVFAKVKADLEKKYGKGSIISGKSNNSEKKKTTQTKPVFKKDTRTSAEKMADATGPRPGSRYRGD